MRETVEERNKLYILRPLALFFCFVCLFIVHWKKRKKGREEGRKEGREKEGREKRRKEGGREGGRKEERRAVTFRAIPGSQGASAWVCELSA